MPNSRIIMSSPSVATLSTICFSSKEVASSISEESCGCEIIPFPRVINSVGVFPLAISILRFPNEFLKIVSLYFEIFERSWVGFHAVKQKRGHLKAYFPMCFPATLPFSTN